MSIFNASKRALLATRRGIQGILTGPTVITTSTSSTATAYSNQRKVDRTSNGVLWALMRAGDNYTIAEPWYSSDNGATWTKATTNVINASNSATQAYTVNFSFFIDLDDYAHVVFKDNGDGYIYYRRGTPNAGRTAWTWSAAYKLDSLGNWGTLSNYPDVVAHREGTGWRAHIVVSAANTASNVPWYARVDVDSAGTVTVGVDFLSLNSGYGVASAHLYPSIDFNHTGDGKTVAGGTPHLYAAWSAGATGGGKGIRFRKATYSGGTWTWGTEREIDSTRYTAGTYGWLNCMFDGTRVVIPAEATTGSSEDVILYERDVADTATTVRVLLSGTTAGSYVVDGSSSYDGVGNIYLMGRSGSGSPPHNLKYYKWTRANNSLSVGTLVATNGLAASMKRGYSNNRIEFIYRDGTASPHDVTYGGIR